MGSEAPEGDIGDSKILEEAKTRQLPSASLLSRSSSCHAPLEHGKDENSGSIPKSKSDGDLSREQETFPAPAHTPQWSMMPATPARVLAPQTTSPPVQKMGGAPSSFNPDRIPESVFCTKPANASDWSMASNDSLFSIHDEWNTSPSLNATEAKSSELCSLPPLMEVPANEEGSAKSSSVSCFEKEDATIDSPKVARGASTPPHLSSGSAQSRSSFAFPVLESDGGKSGSMERVVEEKPEEQTHEMNATQDLNTRRWFSCFPCCCC